MNRALIQAFLVSGVVVSMSIIFASAQDSAAEAALASAISDYERSLKLTDPITAGLAGDRDALRRRPDPRRETELARSGELAEIGGRLAQIDSRDLSAARVAVRHQLTQRQVQRLFESEGTTFTEDVLEQRLTRVRRLLGDPRRAHDKISALAAEAAAIDGQLHVELAVAALQHGRAIQRRADLQLTWLRAGARLPGLRCWRLRAFRRHRQCAFDAVQIQSRVRLCAIGVARPQRAQEQ